MSLRSSSARFGFGVFLLFALIGTRFARGVDASGDEAHYLVMAQSLAREGDLDLRDNYEREDWREFRGGATNAHYAAPRLDGRPFPAHAPGLPALLAPVYALGGRAACVVVFAGLLGILGALVWRTLEAELSVPWVAAVGASIAVGPPVAAYAMHLYTELPSALVLFLAWRALAAPGGSAAARGVTIAVCAVALPWLHPKMALASVALAALAWRRRAGVSIRWFAGVAALGAFHYAWFWMGVYGVPAQMGAYGGVPADATGSPAQTVLGLLFDGAYGLVPIAPVYMIGAALATAAVRRGARIASREEIVVALAVLVPILPWRMWWGGQCPPARFVVPLVPFCALWFARALRELAPRPAASRAPAAFIAAVAVGWGLFAFAALQPGRLLFLNRRQGPTRLWEALWPGGPLDAVWPNLVRPEPADWNLAVAWLSGTLLALLLSWRAASARRLRS